MMYYEKGRFSLGSVSFLLPDQVYIDPEYEAEVQNGFELLDLEKRYRITIEGEYSEEDSATFLGDTLPEASLTAASGRPIISNLGLLEEEAPDSTDTIIPSMPDKATEFITVIITTSEKNFTL